MRELQPFVRLYITSRPHLDLEKKLDKLARLDIFAHKNDVETYLESEFNTNDRLSAFSSRDLSLKPEIIGTLSDGADGMFLLAHLQMTLLSSQSSLKKIRKSLITLPIETHGFYQDAFNRIENQPKDDALLAKRAITFIYCATRPLEVEELRHALSTEVGDTELDETALLDMRILFDVSAGLVRIDEASNTIKLVHHTLQEYLAQTPACLLEEAEAEIAQTCLVYIAFDGFSSGECTELEKRLRKYRFYEYACRNFDYHFRHYQRAKDFGVFHSFQGGGKKILSYMQVLYMSSGQNGADWLDRPLTYFHAVHLLAYWGLDKILPPLDRKSVV